VIADLLTKDCVCSVLMSFTCVAQSVPAHGAKGFKIPYFHMMHHGYSVLKLIIQNFA
jgi:hypothetical protein